MQGTIEERNLRFVAVLLSKSVALLSCFRMADISIRNLQSLTVKSGHQTRFQMVTKISIGPSRLTFLFAFAPAPLSTSVWAFSSYHFPIMSCVYREQTGNRSWLKTSDYYCVSSCRLLASVIRSWRTLAPRRAFALLHVQVIYVRRSLWSQFV